MKRQVNRAEGPAGSVSICLPVRELRRNTDWRSADGRTKYRETQAGITKEYTQAVEELLTPEQIDIFAKLPSLTRNLQSLGQVLAPGEDSERYYPGMREYMQGMRPSSLSRGVRRSSRGEE